MRDRRPFTTALAASGWLDGNAGDSWPLGADVEIVNFVLLTVILGFRGLLYESLKVTKAVTKISFNQSLDKVKQKFRFMRMKPRRRLRTFWSMMV